MAKNLGWDLYNASEEGNYDLVVKLIREHESVGDGSDIVNYQHSWWKKTKVPQGWGPPTPLFIATKRGHFRVAKYLLEKGANSSLRNNKGESPLEVAKRKGHQALEYLLSGQTLISVDSLEITPVSFKLTVRGGVPLPFSFSVIRRDTGAVLQEQKLAPSGSVTITQTSLSPDTELYLLEKGLGEFYTFKTERDLELKPLDIDYATVSILARYQEFDPVETKVKLSATGPDQTLLPSSISYEGSGPGEFKISLLGLESGVTYNVVCRVTSKAEIETEKCITVTTKTLELGVLDYMAQTSRVFEHLKHVFSKKIVFGGVS